MRLRRLLLHINHQTCLNDCIFHPKILLHLGIMLFQQNFQWILSKWVWPLPFLKEHGNTWFSVTFVWSFVSPNVWNKRWKAVWIKLFPTWPLTADHWNQVRDNVCLQKFLSGILMNVQPSYWHQYEKHLYLFTYQHVSVYNQHSFMFWRCSVLLFWAADYWQRKCRRTQVGSRGYDASRDNRWWLTLFWVKIKTTLIWAILISDRLHVVPVVVERTCQAQQSIHNYSNWIINQEAIDALLQQNEEEEEELWPRLTTTTRVVHFWQPVEVEQ